MKKRWPALLVIAAMWAFALAIYPRLPERIPTHWNLHGEVDGWGGRGAAFLFPAIGTCFALLMAVLPRIDPRRANWEKFREELWVMVNVILLFMAWTEAVTLGAALGWRVDTGRAVLGGVGVLLVMIGNYLPRIRSNWFIGIRTPWTLSSDKVWDKTHRLGAVLFMISGVLAFIGAFFGGATAFWLFFAPLMGSASFLVVYSYVLYKQETKA